MPQLHADDLAAWSRGRWFHGRPPALTGLSTDTRTLSPGQLYLALKGDRFDGHAFLARARAAGAAAAAVEAGRVAELPDTLPLLAVADTRQALIALARGYRDSLAMDCVAVTGSVGKTTVKEMTADLLATRGPVARTRGNWNNDIGLPLSLLAAERNAAFGVFELGMSHPGELAPLCRLLRPRAGIISAIGPVHLEFFESVEAIAREKATLLESLPADGLAVLSADDDWYPFLRPFAPCRVLTTAMKGEADYAARRGPPGSGRFTVTEAASGQVAELEAPLPGDFIIQDALLAVALARSRGVDWPDIRAALRHYHPPSLRWQVEESGGVVFVNDAYNANPVSMRAALQALAEMPARGRKWLVLGGMRELGRGEEEAHRQLGRDLAGGPWAGLLAVGGAGEWLAAGARAGGLAAASVHCCARPGDAAALLEDLTAAGDVVLLKASRSERLEEVWAAWQAAGRK